MLSGGASAGLGVVYWALATRSYPPEIVGRSSTAIAALGFLTGLATLYLDGSLFRFLPRAGAAAGPLVLGSYAASLFVAAVVALVFLAGIDLWAPGLAFLSSSWVWVAATVAATMASCIFTL